MKSNDILNRSFSVKLRGFDKEEVRAFLSKVADEVYELQQEKKELERKLELASDEISDYEDKQDALNRSIVVAQDAADRLKEEAHNEANHLIAQAEADARALEQAAEEKVRTMMQEAIAKVHRIQDETEALRQQSVQFNIELNKMLEAYQIVIGDDKWKNLLSIETINQIELQDTIEAVRRLASEDEHIEISEEAENEQTNNEELGNREAVELPNFDEDNG
ncbi:DivIVA domain-containing protein [Dolosigranulum pigrum]|uniref:DivIVA domain-containing protein n=1 Tax=Dolosigranulum pigrum TaxID=29394 RepID=UPI000DC33AF7|nr:DivIVA domain-containing protein [Dolosigranulum pigrum]QJS98535.1 DivIVA domain-containing protein [Dolosigranulum pigrum]